MLNGGATPHAYLVDVVREGFVSRLRFHWVAMLALALAAVLRGVPSAHAYGCQFVLGFATLHDLLPGVVGQCLDDEQHNPANGDGLQHTTKGLLVWRKADNFTAFTDGYSTIVNGPNGLEYRLNTRRFAWEANPDGLPVVPDASIGAAPGREQSGPKLQVTESTLGYARGPLVFKVAGGGFAPGEPVTLQETYAPIYSFATGDPQSPYHELRCATVALGPVSATAGDDGGFTATIQAAENPHAGGEVRITTEVIVDAYDREEQALGWYSYLEEQLTFPFLTRCVSERAISPLQVGDEVDVIDMAPQEECAHEMFVGMRWGHRRTLAVPLSQLEVTDAEEGTRRAVEDWRYWLDRGNEL